MDSPDYLICLDCETPTYVFEWREGKVLEALCEVCGNDDPEEFLTPSDMDELSGD